MVALARPESWKIRLSSRCVSKGRSSSPADLSLPCDMVAQIVTDCHAKERTVWAKE